MRITRGSKANGRRLVLLAPPSVNVVTDGLRAAEHLQYDDLLAGMQRLRGGVYLKDGAIRESQLTEDGRHIVPADRSGWHVLLVEGRNTVKGCARYVSYPEHASFGWLGVSRSPLAMSDHWSLIFRHAVEQEMSAARRQGLSYVEVGGWALDDNLRCTTEALHIALACYALADALGGCIGISTVTWRHGSSTILRRIGGRPLGIAGIELPPYFDSSYDCQMEVLRFDSRELNPRYEEMAATLGEDLIGTVVCQGETRPSAFWPAAEPVSVYAV